MSSGVYFDLFYTDILSPEPIAPPSYPPAEGRRVNLGKQDRIEVKYLLDQKSAISFYFQNALYKAIYGIGNDPLAAWTETKRYGRKMHFTVNYYRMFPSGKNGRWSIASGFQVQIEKGGFPFYRTDDPNNSTLITYISSRPDKSYFEDWAIPLTIAHHWTIGKNLKLGLMLNTAYTAFIGVENLALMGDIVIPFGKEVNLKKTPQYKSYSTIVGLKGGIGYSNIRLGNDVPAGNIVGNLKLGFVAGLWSSFALSNRLSIQPELLITMMGGNINGPFITGAVGKSVQLTTNYYSIPVLFKVHLGKNFAIYAGPQIDFNVFGYAEIKTGDTYTGKDVKDSIKSTDLSMVGGVQVFPKNKVHIDLRYVYGTQDFWNKQPGSYFNQAFQATVGIRLFGKKVTAQAPQPSPPDKDRQNMANL